MNNAELDKIEKFNKNLKAFINIVARLYDDTTEIDRVKSRIKMISDMAPSSLYKIFQQNIEQFVPQIQARDEVFFLENINENMFEKKEYILIFRRVNEKWPTLKDEEKTIIWDSLIKIIQ